MTNTTPQTHYCTCTDEEREILVLEKTYHTATLDKETKTLTLQGDDIADGYEQAMCDTCQQEIDPNEYQNIETNYD